MAPRIHTIGLDTAKNIFQVHGVDAAGNVMVRRKLKRTELLPYFRTLKPCVIGMETASEAHSWGRRLTQLGHKVRLIACAVVKRYVGINKNDANDAAAICEAALRPDVRFVPVKTVKEQADLMVHKVRELLVLQQTQLIQAMRSHLAEFGIITARGTAGANAALEIVGSRAFKRLPEKVRQVLTAIVEQHHRLGISVRACEAKIRATHRASSDSRRLATIPYVGPITANAIITLIGEGERFNSGRDFAAWVGLVPRQFSSGGKQHHGHISKRGNRYLRWLLFLTASGALRHRAFAKSRAGKWAHALRKRKPYRVVVIALAAKLARIIWTMLRNKESFLAKPVSGAQTRLG